VTTMRGGSQSFTTHSVKDGLWSLYDPSQSVTSTFVREQTHNRVTPVGVYTLNLNVSLIYKFVMNKYCYSLIYFLA
jgi:hypothetical protein